MNCNFTQKCYDIIELGFIFLHHKNLPFQNLLDPQYVHVQNQLYTIIMKTDTYVSLR